MSSRIDRFSPPSWGAPIAVRWRVRGGPMSDLAGGSLLLAAWVLLWAFFVMAVAQPAAGLHRTRETAPRAAQIELVATGGAASGDRR